MLQSYSVTFIGNRLIERAHEVERALDLAISDLFLCHEFIEFYVGIDGDFDEMAASCVRRAKKRYGKERTALTLVLPYPKANMDILLRSFDGIVIAEKAINAHPKAAITLRNEWMIDLSDLVIARVADTNGGAGRALRYAEKEKKPILRLSI